MGHAQPHQGFTDDAGMCLYYGCLTLFLALCLYILSFPIPLKQNVSSVPRFYRPVAWLLETPVHRPLEWYLKLWGVEPDYVLCALY
jgi:hypothetical protein